MQVARAQSEVGGETAHVYTDTRYAARTWDHERRVVIKAEVVRLGDREPRDNPRFVVTNLRQTPRFEKVYCARGDIENRIKELLDGRDRPHELLSVLGEPVARLPDRRGLRAHAGTAIAGGAYWCARSQVTWLRDRLLKLGVHVVARSADAAPRGVAAHRTRAGRARRIAHPLRRAHLLPGRHGPLPGGAVAAQPSRPSCPPPGRLLNPGSACRRRCPRPIPAPITPFGGRIWTFMNNAG